VSTPDHRPGEPLPSAGEGPLQSRNRRATRRAWGLWGGVLATLAAVVVVAWLVWGFRWPSTAEVVVDPAPEVPTAER